MKPMRKDTALKLMLAAALAVSSAAAYAQAVRTPYSPSETPSNSRFLSGPEAPAAIGTAVGGTSTAPLGGTVEGGTLNAIPESCDETPSNADFLCGPEAPAVGGTSAAPLGGTLERGPQEGGNLDAMPEQAPDGAAIDD